MPNEHPKKPFRYTLGGDCVASAKINGHDFKSQQMHFATLYSEFGANFKNHIGMSLGYSFTNFNWRGNPYFGQTYFNTLCTGFCAYVDHWARWNWKASAVFNADLKHIGNSNYYNYDFFAWGRYAYKPGLGLHTGFLALTGMHINRIFPIVGFDWQCNAKWKINFVYPVNIAAIYSLNERWTIGIAGRYFFSRHRAGSHYRFPECIYFYRSLGSEFTVSYAAKSLEINFRAGCTFASRLRIARRDYSHQKNFNINYAPYLGGDIAAHF